MSRKIAKITAFLTAGTILMSMTACNSSIDNSQYSLSKIALSDTENAWSNPEAKYAELLKTYGSNSCAGALAVATDKDLVYLYCEDDVEKDGTTPVSQNTVFDIASMSRECPKYGYDVQVKEREKKFLGGNEYIRQHIILSGSGETGDFYKYARKLDDSLICLIDTSTWEGTAIESIEAMFE